MSFAKTETIPEDKFILTTRMEKTQDFLMNSPVFIKESEKLTQIFMDLSNNDINTTCLFVKKYTVIIHDLVEEFRNSNIPLTQVRFEEIISECNAKWFLEKCKNSKVKK